MAKGKPILRDKDKPKKERKRPISYYQKLLWELCKHVIRAQYMRFDGTFECFTCHKRIISTSDAHTAHFIPKAACGANLKYDLRNLRVCCYHCNINLGGNGAIFYKNLVAENGQEYVDQIFKDKNVTIKADVLWYKDKIKEYEKKLQELDTRAMFKM